MESPANGWLRWVESGVWSQAMGFESVPGLLRLVAGRLQRAGSRAQLDQCVAEEPTEESKVFVLVFPPSLGGNRRRTSVGRACQWRHGRSCGHEYLWASVFFIYARCSGGFWDRLGHILVCVSTLWCAVVVMFCRHFRAGSDGMGFAVFSYFTLELTDTCGAFRCTLAWD